MCSQLSNSRVESFAQAEATRPGAVQLSTAHQNVDVRELVPGDGTCFAHATVRPRKGAFEERAFRGTLHWNLLSGAPQSDLCSETRAQLGMSHLMFVQAQDECKRTSRLLSQRHWRGAGNAVFAFFRSVCNLIVEWKVGNTDLACRRKLSTTQQTRCFEIWKVTLQL